MVEQVFCIITVTILCNLARQNAVLTNQHPGPFYNHVYGALPLFPLSLPLSFVGAS